MKIDYQKINAGLVGDIVDVLHPLVEANKESILVQLLVCFGNCIGRSAYFKAAEDKHYSNLFVAIVGQSSRGRKGQALNMIRSLFDGVDDQWYNSRIKKGLASGEGLIHHIRDINPLNETDPFNNLDDKRLLCTESEFSSVLRMTQRDGNILSQILRDCWDGVSLQSLTKNNPMTASNPMVSIIGHITDAELLKFLNSTEIANGLGNRFIYIRAQKDKSLPDPEPLNTDLRKGIRDELISKIALAKSRGEMKFSRDGLLYWESFYKSLSDTDQTVVGALTARQEPQVRRLAMIIALMNGLDHIDENSLVFAEKIFQYSIESLKQIYGVSFGEPLVDKILEILKQSPDGLSRSQLQDKLNRNYFKGSLDRSLQLLKSHQLADLKFQKTPGRSLEIWFAI